MYPIAHVLLAAGAAMPTRVAATGTAQRAAGGEGYVDWSAGPAGSTWRRLSEDSARATRRPAWREALGWAPKPVAVPRSLGRPAQEVVASLS